MSKLSTLANLGPLQASLAIAGKLSGQRSLEKDVLRWLDLPYVRSHYGVWMKKNWDDVTFNLCFSAAYGRALYDLIQRQDRAFVFLDIGANQGLYSLIAGRHRHCKSVVAFEPVPATFAILVSNIAANHLGERVHAVNKAIAAQTGTTAIRMPPGHSGGASMAADNPVSGSKITIDTICRQEMDELIPAGNEAILSKIDVEGAEPVVVAELVKSRHVERIAWVFYEVDETWTQPAQIERMLRDVGFRRFDRVDGDGGPRHYDVLATR